ncbi:MAG TPA: isoamylase early set domain-containing protein [Candidatus Didemnitutus sp.]|nr:isoamylase early set domain-containing protein [Candidatus Didemnitutus sp.]
MAERFPARETREVPLHFFAPGAGSVQVAGDFNEWRPESNPLHAGEAGDWSATLQLRAGEYQYRYVVDGIWREDPDAHESVENPFGSRNSLLRVAIDARSDQL